MKHLSLLLILLLTSTGYSFQVISGPSDSKKTCTTETISKTYTAKATGACAAVEHLSRGYDDYDIDVEKYFLHTTEDEKLINEFMESAKKTHPNSKISIDSSVDCEQMSYDKMPYLFVIDSSYCEGLNYDIAGGCFAQEIFPGFTMPDTYITPNTLPENAKYVEEVELKFTFSSETKTCD